jgi:hypothetical protein
MERRAMRLFPSIARALVIVCTATAASCGAGPTEHRRESVTTVVPDDTDDIGCEREGCPPSRDAGLPR